MKHANGRIQGRAGNGRFRKFSGEEFGIGVCPNCQTLTTRPAMPPAPFIDPVDFNAKVCANCGWDSRKPDHIPQCKHGVENHHVLASVVGAVIQCDKCMCGRKVGEQH